MAIADDRRADLMTVKRHFTEPGREQATARLTAHMLLSVRNFLFEANEFKSLQRMTADEICELVKRRNWNTRKEVD